MSEAFLLNHEKLANDPHFEELAVALDAVSPIDSSAKFNEYCRLACRAWPRGSAVGEGAPSPRFSGLMHQVEAGGAKVIRTSWGGVVITLHEHPRVEKYLVVRAGGYLALEKHEQKDEHLEIIEGGGLILWRRLGEQPLAVQALAPGDRFHLEPGKEHCLIGTENLLVFERSIDPKGMDQDLIFIYEPDGN